MLAFSACVCSHAIVFPNANYVFWSHIYTEYLSEHVFFYNQNRILLAFSLKECQIHCTIQKNYLPLPTKQFTPKGHTVSDISIKLTFHALIFSYQTSQLCIYSEDYSNRRHVECIYCLRSPKCIHTFGEMRKLYAYTFGRGLTVLYYPE